MEVKLFDISTWLVLVFSIIFLYILYIRKNFQCWKRQGIPSPVTGILSYMRTFHEFVNKPQHLFQMELYKKYGRIYGYFIGFNPQIWIAEPHILKNILVKDFNVFHNRMKINTGNDLFDKMLSLLTDDDWKRIRCIISPTFSSSRMRKMTYLVKECAEKFSENMKKVAEENENRSIDCKKYFTCFSIDVIASAAFGTKLSSLEDPDNKFVTVARKAVNVDLPYYVILTFLFPKLAKLLNLNMFDEPFQYFKDFTLHVIKKREKEQMKVNDFLQLLLDAQKGILEISPDDVKEVNQDEQLQFKTIPKHKTMSTDEMLAQCTMILFGGSETTSNTLSFLLYYLALNPECQDRLIQEIDELWNTAENIDFDVLSKMQYLDAVICETLRKEPIAVMLMRQCTEEYELFDKGIKLPKGTNLAIPVYAMHHDKEFFPNPEKFDPERFMPENRNSIPPFVYLPFGEGPRNCIGMRFAVMTLKMCVIYFFRNLRVQASEETKKPLEFFKGQGMLLPKKIIVKLEKRKN